MSDTIIKVENLSKSNLIRHQQAERYNSREPVNRAAAPRLVLPKAPQGGVSRDRRPAPSQIGRQPGGAVVWVQVPDGV
jgi:hypothetical protein